MNSVFTLLPASR